MLKTPHALHLTLYASLFTLYAYEPDKPVEKGIEGIFD